MATTLKHKVTLRKKIAEEPTSDVNGGSHKNGNQKVKCIVTLSVIVVVLAAIAAFILLLNGRSGNGNDSVTIVQDSIEVISNSTMDEMDTNDVPAMPEASTEDTIASESISLNQEDASIEEISATESVRETADVVSSIETPNEVPASVLSGSLEDKARQVIRGNFGNGAERRKRLGSEYTEIQNKVNEMYREELVR